MLWLIYWYIYWSPTRSAEIITMLPILAISWLEHSLFQYGGGSVSCSAAWEVQLPGRRPLPHHHFINCFSFNAVPSLAKSTGGTKRAGGRIEAFFTAILSHCCLCRDRPERHLPSESSIYIWRSFICFYDHTGLWVYLNLIINWVLFLHTYCAIGV